MEPSDFYQGFLRENAVRIPNIVQIHQVLVSGREQEQGTLVHWGGRRWGSLIAGAGTWVDCMRLAEIADGQTRLIKIDTDGFDLPILAASLGFFWHSVGRACTTRTP